MSTNNRQDVITGLRDLADFLETRPPGLTEGVSYMPWCYVYGPRGKDAGPALAAALEVLGDDVLVKQDAYYVDLRRMFGAVELTYRSSIADVSEERTVTKEVTEKVVPALADRQPASA